MLHRDVDSTSLSVLRSIPAAASTFAAFEISRGKIAEASLAASELTPDTIRLPQGLDRCVTPCTSAACELVSPESPRNGLCDEGLLYY